MQQVRSGIDNSMICVHTYYNVLLIMLDDVSRSPVAGIRSSVKAVNVCPLANMLKKISRNMFRPATMNRKGKCSSAALLHSPVEQHASISSHL